MTRQEYECIPPVIQNTPTSCWAAALEWWGLATRQSRVDQESIVQKCQAYMNSQANLATNRDFGTVGVEVMPSLAEVLKKNHGWLIEARVLPVDFLNEEFFAARLPCFTAFPLLDEVECRDLEHGETPDFHAIVVYGMQQRRLLYMDPDVGFSRKLAEDLFACHGWMSCVAYRPFAGS